MRTVEALLAAAALVSAEACAAAPARRPDPIAKAIAELARVTEPGVGFSPSMTGAEFLPVEGSGETGMILLGQPPPARSPALLALVRAGPAAIPALLTCLEDDTSTAIPDVRGLMWMRIRDEYDHNRRTTPAPAGVNVEGFSLTGHNVTVGDLCFVALGQIVNRRFSAVRYQASGGVVVSSPSVSSRLRQVVREEWSRTDAAGLRASLTRDFEQPDHPRRRLGAAVRLAYYFPDAIDPLLAAAPLAGRERDEVLAAVAQAKASAAAR